MAGSIIDHLMELKASASEQKKALETIEADLSEHNAMHADMERRISELELYPKIIKTSVKVLITIATLITTVYGAIRILQARPIPNRPAQTEDRVLPSP